MTKPQLTLKMFQSLIRGQNEAGLPVKLHLGCGTNYFDGWFNIDNNSDQNISSDFRIESEVSENYKLTILSTTYNHAPYIAQALESLVTQKCDFSFQVLIADDCSTDGTAGIIRDYAARYPEIIKPVFRENNLGPVKNGPDLMDMADTEYVTICEGDDYWLDPLKLQKQVDFLENHPECSICFHPVRVIHEGNSRGAEIFPTPGFRFKKRRLVLTDLLKRNFIQTNSAVFRWRFRHGLKYSDLVPADILPQDYYLHLVHAEIGEIGFLDEVMSVYRRHAASFWSRHNRRDDVFLRSYGPMMINFYHHMESRFQVDKSASLASLLTDVARSHLKINNYQGLLDLAERSPSAFTVAFARLFCEPPEKEIDGAGPTLAQWNGIIEFSGRAAEEWRQLFQSPGPIVWRGIRLGEWHIRLMGGLYIRLALMAQKMLNGRGDRLIRGFARHYAAILAHRGSFKKLYALASRHPRLFKSPV